MLPFSHYIYCAQPLTWNFAAPWRQGATRFTQHPQYGSAAVQSVHVQVDSQLADGSRGALPQPRLRSGAVVDSPDAAAGILPP